uniref:Interferon-induced transmembrane protein n=1 Tax=Denticeps clupeoides TaxID=299321 RepID=A0AAY4AH23_9TELE
MEGSASHATVPNYLGWSIFNTLCCCLPLGIAAIIFSVKAKDANLVGDTARAADASKTARTLNIVACVIGVIILIIFIALKVTQTA